MHYWRWPLVYIITTTTITVQIGIGYYVGGIYVMITYGNGRNSEIRLISEIQKKNVIEKFLYKIKVILTFR